MKRPFPTSASGYVSPLPPAPPVSEVRLPRAFVADFLLVASQERWDAANEAENRAECRSNPAYRAFIAGLADSYRAWYPGPAVMAADRWRQQLGMTSLADFVQAIFPR